MKYIRRYKKMGINDISMVVEENASLGETYRALRPDGTADAFTTTLNKKNLSDIISKKLSRLDVGQFEKTDQEIRTLIHSNGVKTQSILNVFNTINSVKTARNQTGTLNEARE